MGPNQLTRNIEPPHKNRIKTGRCSNPIGAPTRLHSVVKQNIHSRQNARSLWTLVFV